MPQIEFKPGLFDRNDWDAASAPFHDRNLPQSWAYGEARASDGRWHVERGLLSAGAAIVGAAQIMVRQLPVVGGGLAWMSRGPMWRRDGVPPQADMAGAALAALRRHYVVERGMYLRIAPAIEQISPICQAFDSAGFRLTAIKGWASASIDLVRDIDVLRGGLEQKWRNALNKAERLGLEVESGEDTATFDVFISEYRDFLAQRGFATTVTPELLTSLQSRLPSGGKLRVFRARHNGVAVGSVVIARCGTTAEYLAGTSLEAGRGLNAGQFLLWRAVADMKWSGFERFDVGGLDPELTPRGVYHFKTGLGGKQYRYVNEIEAADLGWRSRLVRWRVDRVRRASSPESHP